jgi:hypothetical protein
MHVVGHQHVGVDAHRIACGKFCQDIEKRPMVGIGKKIAVLSIPRKIACIGKPAATIRACRGMSVGRSADNGGTTVAENRGLSPVSL